MKAVRDVPHTHLHSHADGTVHSHLHKHDVEHRHVHKSAKAAGPLRMTPWVLFLLFVFGPCEVLIPLLMYPAAEANWLAVAAVVFAFGLTTLATMVSSVMLIVFGMKFVHFPALHRYSHALAGLAVLLCGVLVKTGL